MLMLFDPLPHWKGF